MRASVLALPFASALVLMSACGGSLYAPCDGQVGCGGDLRCVNVGGDTGLCTRPCTVTKSRAGYPDALDEDAYFEPGTTTEETVTDAACSEGDVTITSQEGDGQQTVGVAGDVVGVCRVSPEQLASGEISGDSQLSGWCAPL